MMGRFYRERVDPPRPPGRSFGRMKVHLQYGRDGLDAEIPGRDVTVIEPRFVPGLPDEARGVPRGRPQPDRRAGRCARS